MPSSPAPTGDAAPQDLRWAINKVAAGESLTQTESAQAFELIMSGGATDAQLGALLLGMHVRGETVEEIAGAARVLRAKALPVRAPEGAIDTCGTGGDAKGTHNISTCTAFVVAGAGVPVAKHGNRSISSRSGSADVLAALGVNIECEPETIARCIAECGLGFMFAPAHHAAMRHVAKVRGELGTRTIFNLLGPLANPASMADVENLSLALTQNNWIADIGYNAGAVVKNFGGLGVFGINFIYVDYGDMVRTENQPLFDALGNSNSRTAQLRSLIGLRFLANYNFSSL